MRDVCLITIDGGAISQSSKKQELVMLSMAEVASTHCSQGGYRAPRKLPAELFPHLITNCIFFYSRAALKLATNDNYHAHMIDMRYSSMNFHLTDYSKWRDQTKLIILRSLRFWHDVSKMYSLYHNDACKRCICGMYYRVPQVSNFLVVTRTRS